MRMFARGLACAAIVLAFGLVPAAQDPAPAGGQQEAQEAQDAAQPVFRSGINFVRVDVIVSDKDGAAVADLGQDDFEVVEDGKPQTIETFKFIKLDEIETFTDGPPRPIRTEYDEETEAARDDVRLIAIFLDDYHVRKETSMRVREPLVRFIETEVRPADMVGLMYPLQPLSSIRMTRNHAAIMGGINQFLGRKYDYTPMNYIEERYVRYPTEVVERIRNQVSLSALKALIIRLGSLKEGRKALILVSEGYSNILPPQFRDRIAGVPGSGNVGSSFGATEDQAQFLASADMNQDLRNIYGEANRQNVAIYPVDPRGLAPSEFDVSERPVDPRTDRQFLNSTLETLRILADETDGRAIVNRNDLAVGMKQITRDSSAYYLLGYSSSESPTDGKFHKIDVRVKRRGVQVRARKGYWAFTADDAARATTPPPPGPPPGFAEALAAVDTPARARVVRTWLGTARGANGRTAVTFVWEPVSRQAGARVATEERPAGVSVMALGDDGVAYFRGRVPDARGPVARSTAGGPASSRVTFDAPPGKIQIRLSVEGTDQQVLDSEVRDFIVPDLTSPETALGTPEVFRARTAREFQSLQADAAAVPVAGREFNRSDRLLVRVPVYGAGTPTLTARVLNRVGQEVSQLPAVAPEVPSGMGSVEVPLAGLVAGEYVLEILATGEGGEAKELVGFRVTS
jgi:VWFA-related protein